VPHVLVIAVLFGGYVSLMVVLLGFLAWQVRHRDPDDD